MTNKFDLWSHLEQRIMDCWHIVDDLKVLSENLLEDDTSKDKISNVLIGLEQLYDMKFNKLFRTLQEFISDEADGSSEEELNRVTNEFIKMLDNIDVENDLNDYEFPYSIDNQIDWVDRLNKEHQLF